MKWVLRIFGCLLAVLFIAFLVFRTPDTDAREMRAKYGAAPSQFVEIGEGVRVHLRDEGPRNAPAIVLLHGSAADLHTWEPWVENLRETHRVIRFDQIGHGLTGADPNDDYSMDSFVADIDEVADALALDRFILAGSSMGGAHAVGYAMAHPEKLAGLVLVGASGAPVRPERGASLAYQLAQTPVLNQVMTQITPRSMIESNLRATLSNQDVATEDTIDRYWELLRYPGNRDATIKRFATPRTAFEAEDVSRISMPSLLIWGAEDPLIPLGSGEWYDTHLANSTLTSLPSIGHLPQEEAPKASVATLREWLATID